MSTDLKLTQDRFAQLVMARLKTKGATELQYEPATFSLRFRTDNGLSAINLANGYVNALKVPAVEVGRVIDEYIGHVFSLPQAVTVSAGFAAVVPQLMPVVRDLRYFGMSQLMLRNSGVAEEHLSAVPFRPLAGEVVVALFRDLGDTMAQVTQADLDEWGVSFEQAMVPALDNLRARSELRFTQLDEGLFMSGWQDDFDPSRLLLPELLSRLAIRGDPVVAVPSRSHLLVAGSRDPVALDRLIQATAALLESEERPMTAQLLKLENGSWQAFEQRLRSLPILRQAGFKLLHRDHAQQKTLLDAFFSKGGTDIFVATAQAFDSNDGSGLVSLAQWTRNVVTLLPKTDRLALLDMDTKELLVVPWELAAEVLGVRLDPQGMHPERYFAAQFPAGADLDRLRAGALVRKSI